MKRFLQFVNLYSAVVRVSQFILLQSAKMILDLLQRLLCLPYCRTVQSPAWDVPVPSWSTINVSEQWQILGPFQIGTRGKRTRDELIKSGADHADRRSEATWGADPLEVLVCHR